tara:strand:- start:1379 stop:2248 length:870 start_codon:yes stop_codon:yes gene_type:complete
MPVYLGTGGFIELKRTSLDASLNVTLAVSDVNTSRKRFSFSYKVGTIITGDKIDIARTDGTGNLELVSGHAKRDGTFFAHVDDIGGIRLYSTLANAIGGTTSNALALVTPSGQQSLSVTVRNTSYKPLARVEEYEFTTQRDQVEINQLGDSFKRQYDSGLISGQGSMTCFWEHRYVTSDHDYSTDQEFSSYLARLILRVQQGADFFGRFFLYRESATSANNAWYECDAQITSCSVTVPNVGIIKTNIEFVTSGEFQLKIGATPSVLLQESTDFILNEDGNKISLEDDAT